MRMGGFKFMERYKKALKIRMALLALIVLAAVVMSVYGMFWAAEEVRESAAFGFQNGLVIGIGACALVLMVRFWRIMQDERRLQMFFNAENDERRKAIRAKAGLLMILVTSFLMMLAGSFIGYFNSVVFYTLFAAGFCQLLLAVTVKVIYSRKI